MEVGVRTGDIAEDASDVDEEGEEGVGILDFLLIVAGESGCGGDEGAASAEARGATVAVVAREGLNHHAGDGATEPDI
ncbi:hypothetical protein U1Q18_037288 [Sarracenia purpurea var. burkii]